MRTASLDKARKSVMGAAALLTMPAVLVRFIPSVELVIVIMTIAFFAHGLWITNYITAISDIFGKSATSTIVGFSGSAGALSSLIINPIMGLIIMKYSYDPLWVYAGLMYLICFIGFVIFIPKIKASAVVAA